MGAWEGGGGGYLRSRMDDILIGWSADLRGGAASGRAGGVELGREIMECDGMGWDGLAGGGWEVGGAGDGLRLGWWETHRCPHLP